MDKLLALAVAVGVVVAAWLLFVLIRYIQERLWLVGRPGAALESFVGHFERLGVPADLARTVYRTIQSNCTISRRFGVLPSDSLQAEFDVDRFGGVSFEDLAEDLLWVCAGIKMTDNELFEAVSVFGPVRTVEDLVRLLHHISSQSTTDQRLPPQSSSNS